MMGNWINLYNNVSIFKHIEFKAYYIYTSITKKKNNKVQHTQAHKLNKSVASIDMLHFQTSHLHQ